MQNWYEAGIELKKSGQGPFDPELIVFDGITVGFKTPFSRTGTVSPDAPHASFERMIGVDVLMQTNGERECFDTGDYHAQARDFINAQYRRWKDEMRTHQ